MPKKSKQKVVAAATPLQPNLFDRFEKQLLWQYIILIVVPFFMYVKAVGFEFIHADEGLLIIKNLDILPHWHTIGTAFKTDAFLNPHGPFYRPVQTLSFMLDAWISGERPWMYHLSSVLYHLFTVLSLFALLRLLKFNNLAAFFLSFFFAIHPLLSNAVSWIPARGDVLVGLWGVLLMYCFVRYIKAGSTKWLLLSSLLLVVAFFTKETAAVLPVLLFLYYLSVKDDKISIKKMIPLFILWGTGALLFFVARHSVVSTGYYTDFTIGLEPLINNLPAIPILLAKAFIPFNLSPLPLFENTFTIIGILLLICIAILLIKKIGKKEWLPVIGFVWFIALIVPTLLFQLKDSRFILEYYEYRVYLPMVGLCLFLGYLLNDQLKSASKLMWAWLSLAMIAVFIPIALIHTDDFKDSNAYFSRAAALNNPQAYSVRGMTYFGNRDFENALKDFNAAVAISDGQYALPLRYRATVESQYSKDHQAAETDLTNAILLDTASIDLYLERAEERISLQRIGDALADLRKAKSIDSTNATIYYISGKASIATRDFQGAVVHYTKAIALDSLYTEAYDDRAFAYYQLKDFPDGIKDCNKTISLNNTYFTAYYNKGMMYYEMNQPDKAIPLFDTTLAITDNLYYAYFYRGMAKKQKKDMDGACKDWNQSLSLGFTLAQDTIKRYCK